jgi:hypothetical protein
VSDAFGPGRLFITDARLAFALANHLRYAALQRAFGTSREQANALTFVLALGALEVTHQTARRVFRFRPVRVSGTDAAMGGYVLREAALGIAGPPGRELPMFGTLVTAAVIGRLGLPGLRRAARGLRTAEQRVRLERIERYLAARRAREG